MRECREKGATRPDRVLANREAMALVRRAWIDYESDNGPHALTYLELDTEGFLAEYNCLVKPKPWDVKSLCATLGEESEQQKSDRESAFFGKWKQDEIRGLLDKGQVAAAFCVWCWAAEAYTADLAGIGRAEAKKHCGRASSLRFKTVKATAKLQRGKEAQGEASQEIVDISKLERRTAALAAKLGREERFRAHGTQMQDQELKEIQRLRECICSGFFEGVRHPRGTLRGAP